MKAKAGRNDTCPCGSGKKFKKCCEQLEHRRSKGHVVTLVIIGLLMAAGLAVGITTFSGASDTARPSGVWSPEHGHYH